MHSPIPLVSIIVPAHNHAAFVETAFASIVAQTYPQIELIVIDDGSGDDTAQMIARSLARLRRPMRVEFHVQENRGLGPTLVRALGLAQGEYVQFLASDDALLPDMTARMVQALDQAEPDVAAICCDGYVVDGLARPHLPFRTLHPLPFGCNQHRELMVGNWLPAMGLLYRAEHIRKVGGFDPDLVYEDWGLLLSLTLHYRIGQIPDRLFLYRQHDRNISADRERMHRALQALAARYPQMAQARALRGALGARDLAGAWRALSLASLDLAARFVLRQVQLWWAHRMGARTGWLASGQTQIGPGCQIHPSAVLEAGPGTMVLGPGCRVGPDVRLVAGAGLQIGAGSVIEAGAQVGGLGQTTRLGRACLITPGSHVAGGARLGDFCVTLPGMRVTGQHPDGTWLVPGADRANG